MQPQLQNATNTANGNRRDFFYIVHCIPLLPNLIVRDYVRSIPDFQGLKQ